MPSIEPDPEQFSAFMKSPIEGPIVMLNLLKFKPDGGAESYAKYGELAAPHIKEAKAKILYHGVGRAPVIGGEEWDSIILVEYPSRQNFYDMITKPEYQELSKYRTEALEDSRLYCTQSDR